MLKEKTSIIKLESHVLTSVYLDRPVDVDCFLPCHVAHPSNMSLLLINDGQDMDKLGLKEMLEKLISHHQVHPILCVGIHANENRKMEYGTAHRADYMGRGAKASLYQNFIINELLPYIHTTYHIKNFKETAFAGFSLGGLMALDIVWNHPEIFSKAGVFSGSLWWRTKSLDDDYNEDTDRIMHAQVRSSIHKPGLKFFFESGTQDETADRNNNGIIDSIDDTIALMDELEKKGYNKEHDIKYLELPDGKHDVATWARAMPAFLKWGWGHARD